MVIESLKRKTKTNYNWDDMVYFYDFDVNLVKVIKRELRIGANIYYTGLNQKKISTLCILLLLDYLVI